MIPFCDLDNAGSACSVLLMWQRWLVDQAAGGRPLGGLAGAFWAHADPLAVSVALALGFAALCLLLSLPTGNHSWVDKLWSIVPVVYLWRYALHYWLSPVRSGVQPGLSPRLLAMAGLATLWGARLTYNFYRKGGYRFSAEDYRWPYVRARVHPLAFFLLNVVFIALLQHLLLAAITAPAWLAFKFYEAPLNGVDAAAFGLTLFFILFEAVADQQQWVFQSAKHAKLAARKRLTAEQAAGFIQTGLWRYSRHPNFWAEQCIWWSMYLFGVAATGAWVNWSAAGPLALTLLFQASTALTERITAEKYPGYAAYQATTSRFLPLPPREPAADEEEEEEEEEGAASSDEEQEEEPQPTPKSTRRGKKAAAPTPRSTRKAPAATAPTPAVGSEDEAAAAKPLRRRAAKAAPAQEAEPKPSARAERSPRKTARAAAATEAAPAPLRQSSRLRARKAAE